MNVTKDFITQGITALSPERNLIPRFMKGGGAPETMKASWIAKD
jgi:hypothetical protein